ncbi:UbiA family prenyltransferase [Pistricoccus aurantiacus]|uniref:UbiA family prenyltransferase n=1 Tax=Pistricoccus aurantiacus TaxID=1883414 RepID=UPI0036341C56
MSKEVPGANWRTWLELGRVSNLPTIWTNGLTGWLLAGAALDAAQLLHLLATLSLFYLGGTYLNDAFDAQIDAKEYSERPALQGNMAPRTVALLGAAMLGLGVLLAFLLNVPAGLCGLALALAILLYDWLHKQISWGPVIMGICRLLTYFLGALAVAKLSWPVMLGAFGLFCHVVGLTHAVKLKAYHRVIAIWPLVIMAVPVLVLMTMVALDDTDAGLTRVVLTGTMLAAYLLWCGGALARLFRRQPEDISKAIVGLIAAIALYDAVLIATTGAVDIALLAVVAFLATLALQRLAPGA